MIPTKRSGHVDGWNQCACGFARTIHNIDCSQDFCVQINEAGGRGGEHFAAAITWGKTIAPVLISWGQRQCREGEGNTEGG